jgi:hypothetical protein
MSEQTVFPSVEAWREEAVRRFGPDPLQWKFVCPVCKHVASVDDWRKAGALETEAAFSCVGRHIPGSRPAFDKTGKGPCNYAGGGLFRLNPVRVGDRDFNVFAFAPVSTERPTETPNQA